MYVCQFLLDVLFEFIICSFNSPFSTVCVVVFGWLVWWVQVCLLGEYFLWGFVGSFLLLFFLLLYSVVVVFCGFFFGGVVCFIL